MDRDAREACERFVHQQSEEGVYRYLASCDNGRGVPDCTSTRDKIIESMNVVAHVLFQMLGSGSVEIVFKPAAVAVTGEQTGECDECMDKSSCNSFGPATCPESVGQGLT